ncbi:hypothetical protein [Pararhodobacter aggregans]|uniref:hypothetical protein n=1 Tax=Pararhodobacter aggregans TaxID=404875 RepID=UPI003A93F6CC
MPIILKSAKAKAELKASLAKAEVKATTKTSLIKNSPLKTRADLKGLWAQRPRAKEVFGTVVKVWRGSRSRAPDATGYWAAYTYDEWSSKAELPSSTLRWYLDLLEGHGLIERERHRHKGTRVLAFVRPTRHALELSDGRPGDWELLGIYEKMEAAKKAAPKPLWMQPPPTKLGKGPFVFDDGDYPKTLEEILAPPPGYEVQAGKLKPVPVSSSKNSMAPNAKEDKDPMAVVDEVLGKKSGPKGEN